MKTEWGCKFMTWFRMDRSLNAIRPFFPGTPTHRNDGMAFTLVNHVNGAK